MTYALKASFLFNIKSHFKDSRRSTQMTIKLVENYKINYKDSETPFNYKYTRHLDTTCR